VIAMGQWGTRSIDRVLYCNSNGATATAAIDRFQRGNGNGATGATAIALGQQQQNCVAMAMAMGRNDRSCCYRSAKRRQYWLFPHFPH
jgi:hypothetical protein